MTRKRLLVWVHDRSNLRPFIRFRPCILSDDYGLLTICWGVSYRLNLSRILKPSSVANALGTKADELEKWRLSLLKTEKALFRI